MKKKKDFIFAASTNAFQVEGGRDLCGRTASTWDDFTKTNYFVTTGDPTVREIDSIDVSADLFHKYNTDARIMKKMGLQGLVYCMDWTRICPKDDLYINPEGIKFYYDFYSELKRNGVMPIPVLFHWDVPMWAQVRGGFENRKCVEWFRLYARACFKYLGKLTDYWFVSDENSNFLFHGYINAIMPPQRQDHTAFARALHNLNLAAAATMEEFIEAKKQGWVNKEAKLGFCHDWSPGISYREKQDKKAMDIYDEWFLDLFVEPNFKGTYPKAFLNWLSKNKIDAKIAEEDLDYLKKYKFNFLGWNYYRPAYIASLDLDEPSARFKRAHEKSFTNDYYTVYPITENYTKWNWIVNPNKIIYGAKVITERYGKNITLFMTENGYGDTDDKSAEMILDLDRIKYLSVHLAEVLKAKEQGLNFIGYALWTYCDIFSPSAGYKKDYGLVSVNFFSKIRERKPKLSFCWYQQVIESDGKNLSIDVNELESKLRTTLSEWDLFYK